MQIKCSTMLHVAALCLALLPPALAVLTTPCPPVGVHYADDFVMLFRLNTTGRSVAHTHGHRVVFESGLCRGTEWLVFYNGEDIVLPVCSIYPCNPLYDGIEQEVLCRYEDDPENTVCPQLQAPQFSKECLCAYNIVSSLEYVRASDESRLQRSRRAVLAANSGPKECAQGYTLGCVPPTDLTPPHRD